MPAQAGFLLPERNIFRLIAAPEEADAPSDPNNQTLQDYNVIRIPIHPALGAPGETNRPLS